LCYRNKAVGWKKAKTKGQWMEPLARRQEKHGHRHVDDASQSLWLQQQPSVFLSFSVSFFHPAA
tara:strand:- start:1816 stop:2007 length:192 start_codon:yes stop_codon:yes gene_type:complete